MRAISATALLVTLGMAAGDERVNTVTFAKADAGKLPTGWTAAQTGKGKSEWKVVPDDTAPGRSGYALAQTTADKGATFNLCVLAEPVLKDVEVSVAFKAVAGESDRGGGVVWRYQDANNYYVARMNPLEDNFRVYKVVGGRRAREFQSADVKVPSGEWHKLSVKMIGNHIECFLDGRKHLDVKDDTFTKPGKVGLWTKADAQTLFDTLTVRPLSK